MGEEKISKLGVAKEYEKSVIVQEMIEADISGVLFTSNPQGLLNESVIVCGKGLGENVVSDKVNTTTYYYNNTDDIYYFEGLENLLNNYKVRELIDISKKIVDILDKYLDIEFAIKNNEIYILQARKITTIKDDNLLILDNSNIVESYPGVSLPLTISFVHQIYAGVFKSAIYRMLKNDREVRELEDVFYNMIGDCNGRIYYKISNWYETILRLPFSKKIIPIWQDMMGVKEQKVTSNNKYVKRANLKVYYNFIKEIKNVPRNMELLNDCFSSIYKDYKSKDINSLNYNEVIDLYKSVADSLFPKWDITLFNDMHTFLYTGILKNKLKKKFQDYEEITNNLIAGNKNLESMKPIKALYKLAMEKDSIDNEEYLHRFNEYIELYGDRTIEELKLETETFRTNPELLENKIKDYSANRERIKSLLENDTDELDIAVYNSKIQKTIEKCKQGIKNREISRLNRTRIFGMCREMILRLGIILKEKGRINDIRDVFYLTIQELFDESNFNLQEIIDTRKEEYKVYYKLPSYSRLVFSEKEFNKFHTNINNEIIERNQNTLRGTPCSNGICEGEVVVVDNVNKNVDVKDKIIVTKMTDPGFVFLIANAKGIISEKGSILSHTAIITRELKVPSIVGVKDLMKNLKSGDKISMDANNGIINIIE